MSAPLRYRALAIADLPHRNNSGILPTGHWPQSWESCALVTIQLSADDWCRVARQLARIA